MNKKVYITILVLILIIVIAIVWYFIKSGSSEACMPYEDIASITKTGDVGSCDCLKTAGERKECRDNINGVVSYSNALKSSDISKCENISDIDMKSACISVVQGKIDFAKKAE